MCGDDVALGFEIKVRSVISSYYFPPAFGGFGVRRLSGVLVVGFDTLVGGMEEDVYQTRQPEREKSSIPQFLACTDLDFFLARVTIQRLRFLLFC